MAEMSITIPDNVREYVESQVAGGDYETASDYLVHLVQEDRRRRAQDKLEALLVDSLDSGPGIEATQEWWEDFRSRLSDPAGSPKAV